MAKEFDIYNCAYCGASAKPGTKVLARVEAYACPSCGKEGKLDNEGLWTPPPTCKHVPLPTAGPGAFVLVWESDKK